MKKVKVFAIALVALVASASTAKAQLAVGADVVSSYVWRGVAQGSNQPNIQPTLSYTFGGLTLGAWGSGNFNGTLKEFDLYASYALSSAFSLTLTDYNWSFTKSYFDYSKNTDHIYEGSLNFAGVESLPLSASLNIMFAGADYKMDMATKAYSTYLELGYPLTDNLKLVAGAVFNESAAYGTDGFAVTNLGLKATKSIEITDKFSLPMYGVVGFNPNADDAFFVVGITL